MDSRTLMGSSDSASAETSVRSSWAVVLSEIVLAELSEMAWEVTPPGASKTVDGPR